MSGEKDLNVLLRSLSVKLAPEEFVFSTIADKDVPSGLAPIMVFQEAEGTTLILQKGDAERYGLQHEFPCRMITLNVHSSLEAVGFLAKVAGLLAEHGIPTNPVSGFFHDHLFVPVGREDKAVDLLKQLSGDDL